jgi:hypothetical protein
MYGDRSALPDQGDSVRGCRRRQRFPIGWQCSNIVLMRAITIGALLTVSTLASAQTPSSIPPASDQIAQAVLPLPKDLREGATVLGYAADGKFTSLRAGTGSMVCLSNNPNVERWHVACYHKSLEPFMARGRELRTQGVQGPQVDSVRFREAKEGKLKLPSEPALLYSLTGPKDSFDAASGTAPKATPLFVVYMPYATSESTGLSAQPLRGMPWVMFPGTPKAHIMFVPSMSP